MSTEGFLLASAHVHRIDVPREKQQNRKTTLIMKEYALNPCYLIQTRTPCQPTLFCYLYTTISNINAKHLIKSTSPSPYLIRILLPLRLRNPPAHKQEA